MAFLRGWGRRDWAFVGLCLVALSVLVAGYAAAQLATPASGGGAIAIRTNAQGQTETGEVVTETRDGRVRKLIRWRSRNGQTVTTRLAGRTKTIKDGGETVTVEGGHVAILRRGDTVTRSQTVTRGQTVTKGETVGQTDTVHDTVTVRGPTRTETVQGPTRTETVGATVIAPPETVTRVVTETTVVTETVKHGHGPPPK